MINRILIFTLLKTIALAQSAFPGLDSWTHSNTVGLAGGGYIIPNQNEFRNAGSLVRPDRLFQLSLIKYPADISAQSIIANGNFKKHYIGLFVKNINYGIFDFRTDENIKLGTFSANDTHLKIGYAKSVYKDKLIIGVNTGIFLSQIDSYKAKLLTASPALLLKGNEVSLGFSIENLARVKSYIKAGISSNRLSRVEGDSFVKNLFNDAGLGFGYDFDEFYLDFNIYSYSNTHSIYGITLASKF